MLNKAIRLLEICKKLYGPTTVYGGVSVSVQKDINETGEQGYLWFDVNLGASEIVLYKDNIQSDEVLVRTVIHEYQHALQGTPEDFEEYYNLGYGYEDHPFEIEAESIADRDWEKLLTILNKE